MKGGVMRWFARQNKSDAPTAVGADLAVFLVQATEGEALRQAIRSADSHREMPGLTPTSNETSEAGPVGSGSLEGEGGVRTEPADL